MGACLRVAEELQRLWSAVVQARALGTVLAIGLAFFAGRWWSDQEFLALLEMPVGTVIQVPRFSLTAWKLPGGDHQQLRWKYVPTATQARMTRLFAEAPAATTPTTTATTTTTVEPTTTTIRRK